MPKCARREADRPTQIISTSATMWVPPRTMAARPASTASGWKSVRPLKSKSALAWIMRRTTGHWLAVEACASTSASMMAKESCSIARPAAVSCSVTVLVFIAAPGSGEGGFMGVSMVMRVRVMYMGVGVVVQVLGLGGKAVLAAVALQQRAFRQFVPAHLAVEQLEDALVEAEVSAERKHDVRVLALQALDLGLDAIHQHAAEEIHRHDADLRHAQARLALHHGLEPWPGDAGEAEVHQFVVAVLEQPARHLGEFAIGAGVRRATAEQHHTGGLRVGHVELLQQAVELTLEHTEDLAPHAEVAGAGEADAGVTLARIFDRSRQFHLDVAGSVEDGGNRERLAGTPGGAIQAFIEQHVGMLDEAGFDVPVGVALTPLSGEMQDLLVALAIARAVADEEDGGIVHVGS